MHLLHFETLSVLKVVIFYPAALSFNFGMKDS